MGQNRTLTQVLKIVIPSDDVHGRARDPEHGRLAGLVQKTIQPVAREISRRCGAGDFRNRGSGLHQIPLGG